ncbi:MAG: FHA domain-containing protein [Planctomycetes bacterium]|nr:FHA domain-containing protein [Planctomycetota bacterium]
MIVASGKSAGRSIAIKRNKLLIGRAEQCDVRPLSEEVSRRHCAITVGPTEIWVEDLGSRNGTFVNGTKITERTKIVDGDIVRVASLELKVSCTAPAPQAGGSEDDVSRWLMADDQPAGMSDTTRSLTPAEDESADGSSSSIHTVAPNQTSTGSTIGGSFVSGIDAVPKDESGSGSSRSALEALKAASNSKPSGLPQGAAKKAAADSSRDAAAEALKKFFDRK